MSLKQTSKAASSSSLIGIRLHYRDLQSLFLTKRKELCLCANGTFRMRTGNGARNCGYARMEHLGCAVEHARLDDLACAANFHVLSWHCLGKQEEGEFFGV